MRKMAENLRIAVLGERESVMGFKALGLEVFPVLNGEECANCLHRLARNGEYAIIYMTESMAADCAADIERYKDSVIPAIILIPGREGTLGLGQAALKAAVERAVGADIL